MYQKSVLNQAKALKDFEYRTKMAALQPSMLRILEESKGQIKREKNRVVACDYKHILETHGLLNKHVQFYVEEEYFYLCTGFIMYLFLNPILRNQLFEKN